MRVVGIDIGGANLKFSDGLRQHDSISFELWRRPSELTAALAEGVASYGQIDKLAVTMTGELCDCFATRREGVARIVDAVCRLPAKRGQVQFYQVGGRLVGAEEASQHWTLTAAANWDAIARLVAEEFPQEAGWVLDIGSTTTDLIRFEQGSVAARGKTDFERLRWGELVYCGVARTPLNALLTEWNTGDVRWGLAAEWFASLDDVFVLCGDLPESPEQRQTCDGRPLTREWALRRLGRMLCTEPEEAGEMLIVELARALKDSLLQRLASAWERQTQRGLRSSADERVVLSGSGEWLGRQLLQRVGWAGAVSSWGEQFTPQASTAAAAFAVARLAAR